MWSNNFEENDLIESYVFKYMPSETWNFDIEHYFYFNHVAMLIKSFHDFKITYFISTALKLYPEDEIFLKLKEENPCNKYNYDNYMKIFDSKNFN